MPAKDIQYGETWTYCLAGHVCGHSVYRGVSYVLLLSGIEIHGDGERMEWKEVDGIHIERDAVSYIRLDLVQRRTCLIAGTLARLTDMSKARERRSIARVSAH